MVSKTPHCPKHTKFIPSCGDCIDLRDAWKLKQANKMIEKRVKETRKYHELMPLDKNGNPILTQKYARMTLTPSMLTGCAQLFNELDELGYTFFTQINYTGRDAVMIFKRNK